jgi:regulatory protein
MKITSITVQIRDPNRANISIDGKFRFSLDINQVVDFKLKSGMDINEQRLVELEGESKFGKLYGRAAEYALMRPRSLKEMRDYLYRKTLSRRDKKGELRDGYSKEVTVRVLDRLIEKGLVDDKKFATFWIDNRNLSKGISQRKLRFELMSKGVEDSIINELLKNSDRDDETEIRKIINKKRSKYDDQKLMAYLARMGFNYDLIKEKLESDEEE